MIDIARLTEGERKLAEDCLDRLRSPHGEPVDQTILRLLTKLARARAVVEAAREEHDESDCLGKRAHGLRPHPCKVCDMLAAHDAEVGR